MDTFDFAKLKRNDTSTLLKLVQELAKYEKEPDSIHVTADTYALDGFGMQPKFQAFSSSSDCGRFVWQALDWNEPARRFYGSIGADELG